MATPETPDTSTLVEEKIDAAREASDRMGKFRERVETVAENVKAKASELREKIRETEFDDVVENSRRFVRDNPGKSLAIALGVGFLIGLLVRRRSDD